MVAGLSSLMEPIIIVFLGGLIGGIGVHACPSSNWGKWLSAALSSTADAWAVGLFGLLGLLVGSFLDVVVHRLPLMLERQWAAEAAAAALGAEADTAAEAPPPLNLMVPRSLPALWARHPLVREHSCLELPYAARAVLVMWRWRVGATPSWSWRLAWRLPPVPPLGLGSAGPGLECVLQHGTGAGRHRLEHHVAARRPDTAAGAGVGGAVCHRPGMDAG